MPTTRSKTRAVCVICDGPFPTVDHEGDEVPEWTVFAANEDGDECGAIYRCSTLASARTLAANMARDRRLELVDESMHA